MDRQLQFLEQMPYRVSSILFPKRQIKGLSLWAISAWVSLIAAAVIKLTQADIAHNESPFICLFGNNIDDTRYGICSKNCSCRSINYLNPFGLPDGKLRPYGHPYHGTWFNRKAVYQYHSIKISHE